MITEKDVLDYLYANKDDEEKLKTVNSMCFAFLNILTGYTPKKKERSKNSEITDEEFTQKLNEYV